MNSVTAVRARSSSISANSRMADSRPERSATLWYMSNISTTARHWSAGDSARKRATSSSITSVWVGKRTGRSTGGTSMGCR